MCNNFHLVDSSLYIGKECEKKTVFLQGKGSIVWAWIRDAINPEYKRDSSFTKAKNYLWLRHSEIAISKAIRKTAD